MFRHTAGFDILQHSKITETLLLHEEGECWVLQKILFTGTERLFPALFFPNQSSFLLSHFQDCLVSFAGGDTAATLVFFSIYIKQKKKPNNNWKWYLSHSRSGFPCRKLLQILIRPHRTAVMLERLGPTSVTFHSGTKIKLLQQTAAHESIKSPALCVYSLGLRHRRGVSQ